MEHNKAQGVIEFTIIFSALIFFFVLFFAIIQFNTNQKNLEKQNIIANNIALSVRDEISLASESSEGYSRNFTIPQKLDNIYDYNISINDNRLVTNTDKYQYVLTIPDITGAVVKGNNLIKKTNNSIIIN